MNRAQTMARIKRAKYHTATMGKRKRADFVKACEAATRARKPENQNPEVQMHKLGYLTEFDTTAGLPDTEKMTAHNFRRKPKPESPKTHRPPGRTAQRKIAKREQFKAGA